MGFIDKVAVEWTAYDPEGLIQSFNLCFGDTETPEIYTEDAISPVTVSVDNGKTYYFNVMGFNSENSLRAESNDSKIYTIKTKLFGCSINGGSLSVIETADNGFLVTGMLYSHGDFNQVYLLKTDSNSNLLWEKNFGGTSDDYGRSVVETSDGGLVVTGYTDSFGNSGQVYLLKTDSSGNLLWEKNFGGTDNDIGYSVVETSDGGFVVTGGTSSFGNGYQVYLLKTDSSGNLLWEKNFGGTDSDDGYSVVETSDGGLVVTGHTLSFGNSWQVYLLKTNSTGDLLWEKFFGGSSDEIGQCVIETLDGGLVVTGSTSSFGNRQRVYLVKTDSNGNLLWEKNFGGTRDDLGYSVVETSDGGFVVTGGTSSFGNGYQVYLLKTDSTGNLLWERNFGNTNNDYGYSVLEKADVELVVAGRMSSYDYYINKVYMIWTDSEGNGFSGPDW